MPGHYGKKKPTGQLKLNMQKMPLEVQKKLMEAMKKKKPKRNAFKKAGPYNPFGKRSGMDPSKASRTTGP